LAFSFASSVTRAAWRIARPDPKSHATMGLSIFGRTSISWSGARKSITPPGLAVDVEIAAPNWNKGQKKQKTHIKAAKQSRSSQEQKI
jgi:hypothetical protein